MLFLWKSLTQLTHSAAHKMHFQLYVRVAFRSKVANIFDAGRNCSYWHDAALVLRRCDDWQQQPDSINFCRSNTAKLTRIFSASQRRKQAKENTAVRWFMTVMLLVCKCWQFGVAASSLRCFRGRLIEQRNCCRFPVFTNFFFRFLFLCKLVI